MDNRGLIRKPTAPDNVSWLAIIRNKNKFEYYRGV